MLFSTTTLPTTTYIKAAGGDMISARVVTTGAACYDSATTPQYAVWPLGVEDMQGAAPMISVYPNPAHGSITVAGAQAGLISLYNIAGQLLVSKAAAPLINLDVTGLPAGVYILSIVYEEGSKTVKRILIF